MRLWTIHPKYLDAKGLVALWRESLLAQKVLRGKTRGYRHHPQLLRFAGTNDPPAAVASYLKAVHHEAVERGYQFNARKIGRRKFRGRIKETRGQLLYEWRHLSRKLERRDPERLRELALVKIPVPHPLFKNVAGKVRDWEKTK
jgi:hypothetical protein